MRGFVSALFIIAALFVAFTARTTNGGATALAAAGDPTPTPAPYLQFGPTDEQKQAGGKSYILILALASDVPTANRLSVELSGELHQRKVVDEKHFGVIAAPGLVSVDSIITACANPGHTLAGAIVLVSGLATSGDSYLFATRNWTHLDADVLLIRCTGKPFGPVAQVFWTDNDVTGNGTRWGVNLLPLAAIATAIVNFNGKSEHKTNATTYNYASPLPTPAPGATFASSVTVTDLVDRTNASAGDTSLLGLVALGGLSSVSNGLVVAGASTDALLKAAAKHLSRAFVDDLVSTQLTGAICDPGWFTAWPTSSNPC